MEGEPTYRVRLVVQKHSATYLKEGNDTMITRSSTSPARSFAFSLLLLGSGVSVTLLSLPASAAACRDIATVQRSAQLAYNEEMGGHVAQHILGMLPPWGSSQVGKTMFSEKVEYENAWNLYSRVTNPSSCSADHVLQVVDLDHPIDALSCIKADWSGRCTRWDSYSATEVALVFGRRRNGAWILITAYPRLRP